jgi:hypothetical protein
MTTRTPGRDRADAGRTPASSQASPSADTARFDVAADPGAELAPMLVVVVIAVALLFMILAPLLPFLVDVVVVLVVGAGLVAARLLIGRPWRVEATAETPPERVAWGIVGTRASAAAVDAVADGLARGVPVTDLGPGVPLTP